MYASCNLSHLPWSIFIAGLEFIFSVRIYSLLVFHFFILFFFYIGRNDAVEHYAKISHVSLERCILWNDDKMINLCSLMRCFSYDASVMHFTTPALFILKSGDNKSPCATWQILKIGKSLSALPKKANSFQRTEKLKWKALVVRTVYVKPRVSRLTIELVFRVLKHFCLMFIAKFF